MLKLSNRQAAFLFNLLMDIVDLNETRKFPALLETWKFLEDQLRCEICRSFLDAPMALKCTHVFCSLCIRKFLELNKSDNCPVCKGPASNTDLKPQPRLAGILAILRKEGFRKQLRSALSGSVPQNPTRNAVFAKQEALDALFAKGGSSLGRENLPLYKGLKERDIRNMFTKENLKFDPAWSLDELIRHHKEFIFQIQAVLDGYKMQIYRHPPTREAVQIFWARETDKRHLAFAGNEPKTVDLFLEAKHATAAALLNFQKIRDEMLLKRKREDS